MQRFKDRVVAQGLAAVGAKPRIARLLTDGAVGGEVGMQGPQHLQADRRGGRPVDARQPVQRGQRRGRNAGQRALQGILAHRGGGIGE